VGGQRQLRKPAAAASLQIKKPGALTELNSTHSVAFRMADMSQVMTAAPVTATERSRSWAGLFNCRVPARMLQRSEAPPQQSFCLSCRFRW
jgi:hypothetical protein